MARGDDIRRRLAAGERLTACWLTLGSPIAAEIVALAGFDAVVIDQEHGPGDPYNAIMLMQAAGASGVPCLLRVASADANVIKRALDTGIDGLMVPMVETAEQALAVVAACRFPPEGMRGIAPGSVRAARYGYDRAGFVAARGRDVFVICQVETKATVGRIAAIAAVDGVDMLFIGRNDLASSIGRVADPGHAEAQALL
ncbi:MAG: HpcH/HpaI aldolase family protein, partial [Alphaproteobacteria bacterium]